MISRQTFYAAVKLNLFKTISEKQKQGMDAILDYWEANGYHDGRHLAYCLATAYHEVDKTMQPIEEYGKGKTRPYGKPHPITGLTYYGRGLVQLTWIENYEKAGRLIGFDLVNHPKLALQLDFAVKILIEGMIHGLFTGKKLSHYFNDNVTDPINARRIINSLDKAELIASYYHIFLDAIIN
jgi:putative chitinase